MRHILKITFTTLLFTCAGTLFANGGEEHLARIAKNEGDLRRAVPQFQKAKQKKELSDKGELELLQSYIVLRRVEDAVTLMDELESRMSTRPDYLELRGDCFVMLGNNIFALDAYTSAAKRDPQNPNLYLKLGQLHSLLGDSDSAELAFNAYNKLSLNND